MSGQGALRMLLALISIGGAAAIALVLLERTVDLHPIGRTIALAKAHRVRSAVLSVVAGLVGIVLLAWAIAGRLEKKELARGVSR